MNRATSTFLDLLRVAAALAVVVGHFTNSRLSTFLPDLDIFGVCSVSVFFVMSGFVIAYVVDIKEDNPKLYAAARLSRLYSIMVPAVVFSCMAQLAMRWIDPELLSQWTTPYNAGGSHQILLTAFKSLFPLTYLGSIHGLSCYPVLDSPIWSIGYEAPYYALFGITVFLKGWKRCVLLLATSLVAGIGILHLLPVWWLGVILYQKTRNLKLSRSLSRFVGVAFAAVVALGAYEGGAVRAWADRPHSAWLTPILHGYMYSGNAFLFYYWGSITALAILAVMVMDSDLKPVLLPLEKPVKWMAGHTFSIYLFHYPLLVLVLGVTHYDKSSPVQGITALIAVILMTIGLSYIFEPTKHWWRRSAYHVLGYVQKPRKPVHAVS